MTDAFADRLAQLGQECVKNMAFAITSVLVTYCAMRHSILEGRKIIAS